MERLCEFIIIDLINWRILKKFWVGFSILLCIALFPRPWILVGCILVWVFLIPCSNTLENSELKKDKYFLALGLVRNFKMIIYNSPRKMQCFPNILHHGTPFLPHCRTNNCRTPYHPVSNIDIHKPHKIYPGPTRCQGWIWSTS